VTLFRLLCDTMLRYPSAFGRLLGALDFYLSTPREIVIIGEREAAETRALLREVWGRYLPNKVVALSTEGDTHAARAVPLLRERNMIEKRPTAYVCEHFTCQRPVTTAAELSAQLGPGTARETGREMKAP
jgi:uncharacterized protein YyaL (SSP411 family)